MNYQRLYDMLIKDARTNPKPDSYKEVHHIKPLCMGGKDVKSNLVKLTARQHFIAHELLYKVHRTSKMAHAWFSMSRMGEGQEERRVNSHQFERVKKARSKILSMEMSGAGNPFYKKHHTQDTKDFLANYFKNNPTKRSPDKMREWIENVAKKPKTPEHRRKIGRKGLIMLQHVKTLEIIRVSRRDDRCNDTSWVNPRVLKPEVKEKCRYCPVMTTRSNLVRWHNDKCKERT